MRHAPDPDWGPVPLKDRTVVLGRAGKGLICLIVEEGGDGWIGKKDEGSGTRRLQSGANREPFLPIPKELCRNIDI